MLSVRCSSLPRLVACAASGTPPAVRVEPPRGPADLGTAFHECMARIASGRDYDAGEAAAAHNVDADELAPLVGWAAREWRESISAWFPGPEVEVEMEYLDRGVALTGHADVVSVPDRTVRIGDWKTGWLDADPTEQLKGYAWLAHKRHPGADAVWVAKLDVRHRYVQPHTYTAAELDRWWEWLKAHLADGETFRPGPHCGRCPRALECPGHLQRLKALAVVAGDPCIVAQTPADQLAAGLQFVRLVARRCEQFAAAVKAEVEARGGRYGRLALVASERTSIDVSRGWEHLREALGEKLFPLLKVGKGDVEKAVKAAAARGHKGGAVADLMHKLTTGDALTRTTVHSLEVITDGDDGNPARALPAHHDGDRAGH